MTGPLAIFRKWDSKGDGFIDEREFRHVLQAVGVPDTKIQALFTHADANANGRIEYEEFLRWLDCGVAGDEASDAFSDEADTDDEDVRQTSLKAMSLGRWRRLVRGMLRQRRLSFDPRLHPQGMTSPIANDTLSRSWTRSLHGSPLQPEISKGFTWTLQSDWSQPPISEESSTATLLLQDEFGADDDSP
mmetsp:Transcript_46733/g.130123  ORF Transcript_46733/g.130123 Transcript_46733/m.130123 type:complete len:189 (+) Transcript_46733:201-767(+)